MKLYKFRSLGTCEDLERAQRILKTGEFWCSRFWELNDPMEGVYWFNKGTLTEESIRDLYSAKSRHAICSLSGEKAFGSPLMWGYYANGFRGIAIEIEVESNVPSIVKMQYATEVANIVNGKATDEAAKRILTTKLCCWAHEDEYRHLSDGDSGLHQIGRITAVYFGNPYKTTVNAQDVRQCPQVCDYLRRVESLIRTAGNKITCNYVDVVDGRVRVAKPDAKKGSKP